MPDLRVDFFTLLGLYAHIKLLFCLLACLGAQVLQLVCQFTSKSKLWWDIVVNGSGQHKGWTVCVLLLWKAAQ